MSYCLTCGKNATAIGIGCVSVGDGVHTQGAWQVAMGPDLTVEELGTDPEEIRKQILIIRGLLSLYQSFSEQKFAPDNFFPKAKAVLDHLMGIMERRAEELKDTSQDVSPKDESSVVEVVDDTSSDRPVEVTVKDGGPIPRNVKNNKK